MAMDTTGLAGAMADPETRERAEREAERLTEALEKSVQVELKDVGTLRKELRVTVPESVISEQFKRSFEDLLGDIALPGFRKGRAPRQLVERRFRGEVRDSLKTSLLGQSFFAAAKQQKLEVLGDPLFQVKTDAGEKLLGFDEAVDHVKLPDSGNLTYTCEVEVKPTFELPPLEGIPLKKKKIAVTDEMVTQSIERSRKVRGRLEPVTDGAADAEDVLIADVTLRSGGQMVKHEDNVQLGVRATRLDGISLLNLGEVLKGARPGDVRTTECKISDDYERPDLRGQPGEFEFRIHELKRLASMPLAEYLETVGYESEAALREDVRADLVAESDNLAREDLREQVLAYLLDKTQLDLPPSLSARQTDRAVVRRVIELQQKGVPMGEVEAHIDELRTSAKERVAKDLKVGFVLEKVAAQLEVRVAEEEIHGEIARIARLYSRRFDRVRDDLHQQGLLPHLADHIRQDKVLAWLIEKASIAAE